VPFNCTAVSTDRSSLHEGYHVMVELFWNRAANVL
jgi:hypothetical protein